MNSKNLFLIGNIGWLDWAKVGPKGRYTNICFTIFVAKTIRPKEKKGLIIYKTVKRRLRKVMSIRLGLTLLKPQYMPILVDELSILNEKNRLIIQRTTRLNLQGQTTTHHYPNCYNSTFKPSVHKFFRNLKIELGASLLNYRINCNLPGYVEITATIDRHTFNFPSKFIIDLVAKLNSLP